jgi:hypothetical protein
MIRVSNGTDAAAGIAIGPAPSFGYIAARPAAAAAAEASF